MSKVVSLHQALRQALRQALTAQETPLNLAKDLGKQKMQMRQTVVMQAVTLTRSQGVINPSVSIKLVIVTHPEEPLLL